jgi:hypothetical protein
LLVAGCWFKVLHGESQALATKHHEPATSNKNAGPQPAFSPTRANARYRLRSMNCCRAFFGAAPTMRSTSWPFLNIISVGIEVTP